MLKKLHHVAYRCRDAAETAHFYVDLLGLKLSAVLVQEDVPSLRRNDPHNHVFFELADGSFVAFFDVLADAGPFVPPAHPWAQHLALEVESHADAERIASRLRAHAVEVVGPVDHGFCASWYFFDPSGHRIEMSVRTEAPGVWSALAEEASAQLAAWSERKLAAREHTR
jgi:catechol 2,3-dioxygenase-like lactoylglutathione lyase family enzyme